MCAKTNAHWIKFMVSSSILSIVDHVLSLRLREGSSENNLPFTCRRKSSRIFFHREEKNPIVVSEKKFGGHYV